MHIRLNYFRIRILGGYQMVNEELVDQIQKGINPRDNVEQLYRQNKGFIISIIKKYRYACQSGYNATPIIEMDELMHEAYFGLYEAVKHFDLDKGNTFLTYAEYWIRQTVKRFLDNSGRVIRVPVYRQQEIYKYNQATAHYLSNYNRLPSLQEYACYVDISVKGIEHLEKFMFQGRIISLDATIPGEDNDDVTIADIVASDVDIENDIVEKVAQEQIREELWDIVAKVLKDKKKLQIFQMRYINNMTMEQIGEQLNVSRAAIDQALRYGIRMIRRNSRARDLGEELEIYSRDVPFNANIVKRWALEGKLQYLDKRELKYAANMGWVDSGIM